MTYAVKIADASVGRDWAISIMELLRAAQVRHSS